MAAMDKLRSKKTEIIDTLSGDRRIFDKVQQGGVLTLREYRNVTNINRATEEGHVIALVDKIMNKGEETCQKFLNLLQTDEDIKSTYSALERILTNTCILPTPVQAASSDNLDGDSQESKRQKKDEPYQLNSQPVGLCVIMNNENFKDKTMRRGTDKDARRLAEVFSRLGFRVLMCKDQETDQMVRALKYFASPGDLSQLQEFNAKEWSGSEFTDPQEAPKHGDAFICCVLSHGTKGVVLGTDRKHLSINEIISTFKVTDDSALTGKPKVFLIQACQGAWLQPGVLTPDLQTDDSESVFNLDEADFLVAIATVEDYKSIRHTIHGSWFIQSVCQKLEEDCPRGEDISKIFYRVKSEVSLKEGSKTPGAVKQMPETRDTLTKRLVLLPRHN
ncbi:caspase-8-like [Scomber japonicus]|uniref:caspase-8-like n=1 Tax=Scomber japonicus TaxID=13676 RepID=UPI0023065F4F|nr:caspase-8-like [Scomber japonicus]